MSGRAHPFADSVEASPKTGGSLSNMHSLVTVPMIARARSLHRGLRLLVLLTALAGGLALGREESFPSAERFSTQAQMAGLRVLSGRRLILATDRPARAGDGVEELCEIFDQAFATWCQHYGLDPEQTGDWRSLGCLVVDRERFRAAGLLPDSIPPFVNGYCDRSRFWMADQPNPDYRRHLLLHEGAHAFTLTLRGLDGPTWYTEGIAEYLATHRLDDGRFVPTPIPLAPEDVEQLGRIEELVRQAAAGEAPTLESVLSTPGEAHRRIADYAASWAVVAMLINHPRYAADFLRLERGPLDATLTERLRSSASWNELLAHRDFAAFVEDIDHGYDFARSSIDWMDGQPLVAPAVVSVQAGKGWQNTGISITPGGAVSFEASGRCRIGQLNGKPIATEAGGISLGWHRGRPLGRLLLAQWIDVDQGGSFVVLGEGAFGSIEPRTEGPLFVKLNEPPGELADGEGAISLSLAPVVDGSPIRRPQPLR